MSYVIKVVLVLSIFFIMLICAISCKGNPENFAGSMVQVWISTSNQPTAGSPDSFGVAAGKGDQVLTFFNYESWNIDEIKNIQVGRPGEERYPASIQAMDPRTGATLLDVEGTDFPAASFGDISKTQSGQQLFIQGWSMYGVNQVFRKRPLASTPFNVNSIVFSVIEPPAQENDRFVDYEGAAITDDQDKVLGLETAYYMKATPSGPVGGLPPIFNVNSAMEYLSANSGNASQISSPIMTFIANKSLALGGTEGTLPGISYKDMTAALARLSSALGSKTSFVDIQPEKGILWNLSLEGTLLIATYARPIQLRDTEGTVLASAKWFGIEWGRSEGKPNRLVYGSKAYIVDGGYELKADITEFSQMVQSILAQWAG